MGAYMSADPRWAAQELDRMVPKKLANLAGLEFLTDSE